MKEADDEEAEPSTGSFVYLLSILEYFPVGSRILRGEIVRIYGIHGVGKTYGKGQSLRSYTRTAQGGKYPSLGLWESWVIPGYHGYWGKPSWFKGYVR